MTEVSSPRAAPAAPGRGQFDKKTNVYRALSANFAELLKGIQVPARVSALGPNSAHAHPPLGATSERFAAALGHPTGKHVHPPADEADPLVRSLAMPAWLSPGASAPAGLQQVASPVVPLGPAAVAVVEEVVRRIAWGGDRRRGVARIELGGEHLGTAIVVEGHGRALTLSVELPPGAPATALPERLAERLRARGLDVARVEVR